MGLSDAGVSKYTFSLTTSAATSAVFPMRRTARIRNNTGSAVTVSFFDASDMSASKTTWPSEDASDLTIAANESKAVPSALEANEYVVLVAGSGTPSVTVITKD